MPRHQCKRMLLTMEGQGEEEEVEIKEAKGQVE